MIMHELVFETVKFDLKILVEEFEFKDDTENKNDSKLNIAFF